MQRALASAALAVCLLTLAAPAHAQNLEQTLDRIAAAWHKGDASAISALAARAGISVDTDGSVVGPLGPRQAAAALRGVFSDRESVSARTNVSRTVGGQPEVALGEIVWSARVRGTTIPELVSVFIGLVREDGSWRITEIRLKP